MRKICFAILLLPALAWAQPKTADEWYKEGADQFNLGEYGKAVEAFKQGFTLESDEAKKPAYLYNVAQSYRLAKDCKNALFFYKRFLALKDASGKPPEPKVRKDVNTKIAELEACVAQEHTVSTAPPTNTTPPSGGDKSGGESSNAPGSDRGDARPDKNVASTSSGSDEDDRSDTGEPKAATRPPRMLSVRFDGGGSSVNVGKTFQVPVQATFAIIGGYPIPINNKLLVEAGAALTLTPVPYDVRTGGGKTALLTSVMANGAATYEVAPKIGVRGDVGIGALFFSNVSESQFTNFAMTSGALSMFHLRIAASADYAFTPNIVGTVTPLAFTWSPPKSGLDSSIDNIITFDFMVGIGYRM